MQQVACETTTALEVPVKHTSFVHELEISIVSVQFENVGSKAADLSTVVDRNVFPQLSA